MELTEKQILKILKNNKSVELLTKSQQKQVFDYAFGEEFMESANKGDKVKYAESKRRLKGIVNKSNRFIHSGRKGQPITIIKSFFYNGEGWYLTEEIGELPDVFVNLFEGGK